MLRCAESCFSKGIFRTSVGKRKRLVGCIWQSVDIALVPAKSAFAVELLCMTTLDVEILFFCMHKCVRADVLLEMCSL